MHQISVLLLSGGLQGLCMAESLYSSEIPVDILTSRKDVAFYSRFFRNKHVYNGSDYLEQVIELIKEHHYSILIPMSDNAASFVSKNKDLLMNLDVQSPVPSFDVFEMGTDKSRLMNFCECHHIGHPRTREINDADIESIAEYVGFPSLIKPNHSVGSRGIRKVSDMRQLISIYPNIKRQYGACTLQKYIDNDDYYYNVMIYRSLSGDMSANAIIKIIRKYPLNAGSSCFCISVENPGLLEMCQTVLSKMGWYGMADFDVLHDNQTDEYHIIEINPRVPASLRGGVAAGIDFAGTIVRDLCNLPVQKNLYKTGIQLRYFGLDLMWFLKSSKRFSANPSWFKFTGDDLYYQDCYKNDPLPFIMSFPLKFIELFKRK